MREGWTLGRLRHRTTDLRPSAVALSIPAGFERMGPRSAGELMNPVSRLHQSSRRQRCLLPMIRARGAALSGYIVTERCVWVSLLSRETWPNVPTRELFIKTQVRIASIKMQSHSDLDSEAGSVVCFLIRGVSPLLGFSPFWFYEEVTPPDLFTHELRVLRCGCNESAL